MNNTVEQTLSPFHSILKAENFIGNKWIAQGSGEFLTVLDKYHNNELARIPMATIDQAELAIQEAVKGFEEIKSWSAGKRSDHLYKLSTLLSANRDAFIDLIIKEAGKPYSYAANEIDRCVTTVNTAAAEALRFGGEVVPLDYGAGEGKTAFTKRFPVGVITCITPFNFPLNLVLHKVAPALACGCSVIVKPAPQSPLCTLALASMMELAGYPAGIFNAMVCDIPVAEKLVRDDRIAMLSFTGSDKVGWYLKSICGKKKVALELGGNASVIIDETADIDAAAKKVAVGAYIYAGQVCISTQRIFVQEDVYDQFTSAVLGEISKLKVGDPNDKDVLVGPIIDKSHLQRVNDWVKEAKSGGAQVLSGGKIADEEHNVYEPTLLTGTNNLMKVSCAEVFGPVAVIEKVKSFNEGIIKSNDSNYGLQTGIYTNRFDRVKKAHEELEVGGVMVNNIPGFRIDSMPYGGVKDSGFGREGIIYAMEEMTEGRLIVY